MSDTEQPELLTAQEGPESPTIEIDEEMKNAYLEYAMSVIVGRALPDVRDGLKPVHRRILYSMYESGYTSNRAYKKCARIVGDVLGRYHPHGDTAVYDSLVRMAQDFSLRYPLIDGQGNYGSVDGDNAAAMRYTEARMARISMLLLEDIDKDTVDFGSNFDDSLEEPKVLPARLPTLLLNGTAGIAVGMATNIPPHNLSELTDAIVALIDNPDLGVEDLMQYVKGPDFPTYGEICGSHGIRQAYETGRGIITIRSKVHFEDVKKKRAIIVDEIPYQVNKANLIMKIAELVNDKKLTGISDLRDESDRKGMRIYIELKRDAHEEVVLNQLYKHTQLQTSFGINMVALVKGIPQTLGLKAILTHYIEHRKEIVTRRTVYDLKIAKDRLHILEGLRIALDHIDEIIALIKRSENANVAREGLISTYALSEKQANAILDMRLQRLTGLEREKIENEYQDLLVKIKDLEDILSNVSRVYAIIKNEQEENKKRFGDERRTIIGAPVDTMDIADLIPEQAVTILLTQNGFIKRMPIDVFKSQLRGGRGVSGMTTREEDLIDQMITTSSHDFLLCFTSTGKVHKVKAYEIPESSRASKGTSVAHFLNLEEGEAVTTIIPVKDFNQEGLCLVMVTRKGIIKRTSLSAFSYFKTRAIIAINLDDGDSLGWVMSSNGHKDVIMATSDGMMMRFSEAQVREVGRGSRGVRAIKIREHDTLAGVGLIDPNEDRLLVLLMTLKGYGKNMKVNEFRTQGRGGVGVKALKFRKTIKGDKVIDMSIVKREDEFVAATKKGTICRQKIANISVQRRESQGVIIIKLDADDEVTAIAKVISDDENQIPSEKPSADASESQNTLFDS